MVNNDGGIYEESIDCLLLFLFRFLSLQILPNEFIPMTEVKTLKKWTSGLKAEWIQPGGVVSRGK